MLIAARHILQTDFRTAFVPYIDTLVDDRVLIGVGVTCHEQLRPLAYSMMADLVHHVREELNIATLAHVIHIYSCNLHDPTLAPSIQTMCSKLLLNLTENVVKTETEDATLALYRSMEAFVRKVENLAETKDEWKKWARPAGVTAKGQREKAAKEITNKPHKEDENKSGVSTTVVKKDEANMAVDNAENGENGDTDVAMSTEEHKSADDQYPLDDIDDVDIERAKPVAQHSIMTDTTTDVYRGVLCSHAYRL